MTTSPTLPAFSAYSSNFCRASSALTSRSCTSICASSALDCVVAASCFVIAVSSFSVCFSFRANCPSVFSSSCFNRLDSSESFPVASQLSSYASFSDVTLRSSSVCFSFAFSKFFRSVSVCVSLFATVWRCTSIFCVSSDTFARNASDSVPYSFAFAAARLYSDDRFFISATACFIAA